MDQPETETASNEKWDDPYPLCTFAATGNHTAFQPIYICHTCSKKTNEGDESSSMPLCICQSCAEACHEALGHDVDYVGTGQAYCDCHTLLKEKEQLDAEDETKGCCSCVLYSRSCEVAQRLGINVEKDIGQCTMASGIGMGVNYNLPEIEGWDNDDVNDEKASFRFTFESLSIPALISSAGGSSFNHHPCDVLIDQAKEFVKHSKDTHWIPHDTTDLEQLCGLEQLAFKIFQRHVEAYNLKERLLVQNSQGGGGAEWWVQVKNIQGVDGDNTTGIGKGEDENQNNNKSSSSSNEAIDLHYDKDEELAEAFELGSFPTLSTVTYLTGNTIMDVNGLNFSAAPPTVIFPHTYEMNDEGPIGGYDVDESTGEMKLKLSSSPQMIVSHSRRGKHIVFDGKLLHGVPSNLLLRHEIAEGDTSEIHKGLRVTFLVNIWLTRRPSKVTVLPQYIRDAVKHCHVHESNAGDAIRPITLPNVALHMEPRSHEVIRIDYDDVECNDSSIKWIHLPFVSSGATWVDDMNMDGNGDGDGGGEEEGENEESGLVVSIVTPRRCENDTTFVSYSEELAPLLEYVGEDDDDDESEGDVVDDDESCEERG